MTIESAKQLGGRPGEWAIEYEIPPLRAIYHVFGAGESTEQEIREAVEQLYPTSRIRKLSKVEPE